MAGDFDESKHPRDHGKFSSSLGEHGKDISRTKLTPLRDRAGLENYKPPSTLSGTRPAREALKDEHAKIDANKNLSDVAKTRLKAEATTRAGSPKPAPGQALHPQMPPDMKREALNRMNDIDNTHPALMSQSEKNSAKALIVKNANAATEHNLSLTPRREALKQDVAATKAKFGGVANRQTPQQIHDAAHPHLAAQTPGKLQTWAKVYKGSG